MKLAVILNDKEFEITIIRLCHELLEKHTDFNNTVIIGLQPRGIYLASRIRDTLCKILPEKPIACGQLDVTFHRDDFGRRTSPLMPGITDIEFSLEDKNVIIVDDVLYTGRTIRSGLDALLSFGRPCNVELLVLIDRRFSRQLPIHPDYVGKWVDSLDNERVEVSWKEIDGKDGVTLLKPNVINKKNE